jgi:hypothetical protein
MSKRAKRPKSAAEAAKIWSSFLETRGGVPADRHPFNRRVAGINPLDTENGGAYRDRTDDLKLAKLALSQLS